MFSHGRKYKALRLLPDLNKDSDNKSPLDSGFKLDYGFDDQYNDDTVAFINYLDKSCAEKAFLNMNGYRMGYQIIKVEVLNK